MPKPYCRNYALFAFNVFLCLMAAASAQAATFVALPDNNPVAAALLQYSAGTVNTPDTATSGTYVPVAAPLDTTYLETALSATPSVFAPARVANSALATPKISQATPASLSLVLSTLTPSAPANSNVTITLSLVDSGDTPTGPGSSLFSFDTNIGVNNTYLTFLGGFVANPASGFTFNDAPPGTTASNLRVAYDVDLGSYVNASSGTPITLGTFVVHVGAGGLPAGGSAVTLGSPATLSGAGGSEVISSAAQNVLTNVTPQTLTPAAIAAPEPSGAVPAIIGIAGISILAWRKRVRTA